MHFYILYFFILISSCAQKKSQEPIETKSRPATSDSFASIAKDTHKKLTDFIHQNRTSSDPATKQFLALAEETLNKQSEQDLEKALSSLDFEEQSAIAEYAATVTLEEQTAATQLSNEQKAAIGGTLFGGMILIAGVGGGFYSWKGLPQITTVDPKDFKQTQLYDNYYGVFQAYFDRREKKFNDYLKFADQYKTIGLVDKKGNFLDPNRIDRNYFSRVSDTDFESMKAEYTAFLNRFFKRYEEKSYVRKQSQLEMSKNRAKDILNEYMRPKYADFYNVQGKLKADRVDALKAKLSTPDLKEKITAGISREEFARLAEEDNLRQLKSQPISRDQLKRDHQFITDLITISTEQPRDPAAPSSSTSSSNSSYDDPDAPRRAFNDDERGYQRPRRDVIENKLQEWLNMAEDNPSIKLQYHLVKTLDKLRVSSQGLFEEVFDRKKILLIINDESVFNQFKKRVEDLEKLAGIEKGQPWTDENLIKLATKIGETTKYMSGINKHILSYFFNYNPPLQKFNNDSTDIVLKAIKVGDRNDRLRQRMQEEGASNQNLPAQKSTIKNRTFAALGIGTAILIPSAIFLSTSKSSPAKDPSSKTSEQEDSLQLASAPEKKHPVLMLLEDLSDLQERAVLIKETYH